MIIFPKILGTFESLQHHFCPMVVHIVDAHLWKWNGHYYLGQFTPPEMVLTVRKSLLNWRNIISQSFCPFVLIGINHIPFPNDVLQNLKIVTLTIGIVSHSLKQIIPKSFNRSSVDLREKNLTFLFIFVWMSTCASLLFLLLNVPNGVYPHKCDLNYSLPHVATVNSYYAYINQFICKL